MGAVAPLLDLYLPANDVCEYHEIEVDAPTERAYDAVRTADLAAAPSVRLLFLVRGLPAGRFRVDDFRTLGFALLDQDPGREIVVGAIGRPWRPRGATTSTDADTFAAFDDPGYAKMAANFRVSAVGSG